MNKKILLALFIILGTGLLFLYAAYGLHASPGFQDVLDMPVEKSPIVERHLFNGVVAAGKRFISVGQYGIIIYSDDDGKTWTQANVPVSSDLTAVYFITPQKGWAVGHDGVVLYSCDAGKTWMRQLDGREVCKALSEMYLNKDKASKGTIKTSEDFKKNVDTLVKESAANPFLDVFFISESEGFIVGAFNLIFHTVNGGKTWIPWLDRTDNPRFLHLYSVKQIGQDIFIAGESGIIMKMDQKASRFQRIETPYRGTYFGIAGKQGLLVAFGLRGNVYKSENGGKKWVKLQSNTETGLNAATVNEEGRIILVSQGGDVLVMKNDASGFNTLKSWVPGTSVAPLGKERVVTAGFNGMMIRNIQ